MRPYIAPAVLALAFSCAALASVPAGAMSTAQERDWGRDVAREVIAEDGRLEDPLLERWVDGVGRNLLAHAVRADVLYTFTVVDSEEVNAFSVPGGFIFVDAGLLNFVHSDDELAAVLGHEIGHVERRHIVTISQKAKALEIVLDIARIVAPALNRFGDLAGELALYKISRVDELQADQYGLRLMTEAGYDPDGMVSFLKRLETVHPGHKSLLGRYFETHPALRDRVAHLSGYPELDRPAPNALLAQGIRDAERGEYLAARQKFGRALSAEPGNALAQSRQRQVETIFDAPITGARIDGAEVDALRRRAEADVIAAQRSGDAVKAQLALATKDVDNYERYLEHLGYYVDPQSREGIARGGRLDRILSGQVRVGRYMDHSYDQTSQAEAEAQDIAEAALTLAKDVRARLDRPDPSSPIDAARFGALLNRAEDAIRRSAAAAVAIRGAIAVGWQSGKAVSAFLDAFDQVSDYKGGDMKPADYHKLHAPLRAALVAARSAATAADRASAMLNDAQTEEVLDRIDMLAVDATPARASAFAALLSKRFGVEAAETLRALRAVGSPGDVAVAAVIAAERQMPLEQVVASMSLANGDPVRYASSLGLRAETLQLELGMVWLSYASG